MAKVMLATGLIVAYGISNFSWRLTAATSLTFFLVQQRLHGPVRAVLLRVDSVQYPDSTTALALQNAPQRRGAFIMSIVVEYRHVAGALCHS